MPPRDEAKETLLYYLSEVEGNTRRVDLRRMKSRKDKTVPTALGTDARTNDHDSLQHRLGNSEVRKILRLLYVRRHVCEQISTLT